ncbi:MAG: ATP-binding protein [Cyclobacteriaceae bacterium]
MIIRRETKKLNQLLQQFPAVGIIGSRQCGKTTLAKNLLSDDSIYLDLESDLDLAKLFDPGLFLRTNKDKRIIIDEVQRMPELFPLLRSLIDDDRRSGRFILLGSASPTLLRSSSESLAGRIAYHELTTFDLDEVGFDKQEQLWLRGGYPRSFLARSDVESLEWRRQFIRTFIERDLPNLGLITDTRTITQFVRMLTGSVGQIWNASTFAKSLGVTSPTIKKYLTFLEHSFLIDVLEPFHINIKKRLVKSPKIYFKDVGILHALINIQKKDGLINDLIVGNSWENFALMQVKNSLINSNLDFAFYRTHEGTEADLVLIDGNKPIAVVEIKYTNAPKLSKGLMNAIDDLKTDQNFIITPGSDTYPVHEKIQVMSISNFLKSSPIS